MALNRLKFNTLLNVAANSGFTVADNVAYPPRKACAVCPQGSGMGYERPANLGVVATGAPCPNPVRRWNVSKAVPLTPSGFNHWATCFVYPSGGANSLPTPMLLLAITSGSNPPEGGAGFPPDNYWVKVGPVGSML